ncbi:type II secretion system F family protein [Sphingomonas sp. M1-B02]|uniref:type II secretion system F family protein n=1 Tax=Sphingomonas sp. M1-B02 TaxID=3114300 RepID=UPI00223F09F4|nr:type II secretion system F family protein [Sphingomonas sp. S6-11]UZK66056.1 type II secretion system F family protein [Sphingomonas sp. S6-11]
MDLLPVLMLGLGAFAVLVLMVLAFSGPSATRAGSRRLTGLRERHLVSNSGSSAMEAQIRKVSTSRPGIDGAASRFLPNPAELQKRLNMTGKSWTLNQYMMVSAGLVLLPAAYLIYQGAPIWLALFLGLFVGLGLPHKVVSFMMKRRIHKFTVKFPDAIELLVRGLRSGLPITETMSVVGSEVDGPVGEEFRSVSDKMKIGRTLDAALQETADRLGTPEFQFFVITIAIQRETGGNLAETLANLADVLRKRSQMKLKIKAMSSESKASALIVGALPFIVFGMVWFINNGYMLNFFKDERLMVAGAGGLIWMALGAWIMAKMVNFEI